MKKKLFISGPTSVSDEVKNALNYEDISHRDIEFENLLKDIQDLLIKSVNADKESYTALITTGSGTSAVEAMVASFLSKSNVLVISNGAFGDRLYKMSNIFQCDSNLLNYDWGSEFDLNDIEKIFIDKPKTESVLVCWVETSTGVLNPIYEISDLCEKYKKKLFVDSVSALGSEDIDLSGKKIECIASHSGKALGSYPGIGIVLCKHELFNENREPVTYYLDLKKYYNYSKNYSQTPHTPAIPLIFSLKKALENFTSNKRNAFNRLDQTYKTLNDGLLKLGISLFLSPEVIKCRSLIAAYVPKNITFDEMKNSLKKKGYIIYGGRGYLEKKGIFLISVMSTIITVKMVKEFLNQFKVVLNDKID
tara:strand:+ start:2212 stop:3303 length:1092 start_codon:yes stop_codon:yes gene_type:complete